MFDKTIIYNRMRRYRMKGYLAKDAPMTQETSIGIGGPADILFSPDSIAEAVRVVRLCKREKIPLTILGRGTNMLVRDGGIRGVVLKLGELRGLRRENDHVFAGAGLKLSEVSGYAMSEGLSGLEFACGIPGSVGGAVGMNAGAYGKEMKDVVYRSAVLDLDGDIGLFDNAKHGFGYRKSVFQQNGFIILEAEFSLTQSNPAEIASAMKAYDAKRTASQPVGERSAGSVFKRPDKEGAYVGPMVEACGLKGAREGGAKISEKHAGFIVNSGGATAADVLALIGRVREAVRDRFSIELEMEIRVIGED